MVLYFVACMCVCVCVKFYFYFVKMILKFKFMMILQVYDKSLENSYDIICCDQWRFCLLWNIWVSSISLYLQYVLRIDFCLLLKLAHGSVLFMPFYVSWKLEHDTLIYLMYTFVFHFIETYKCVLISHLLCLVLVIYCRCWTTMCLEVGIEFLFFLAFNE